MKTEITLNGNAYLSGYNGSFLRFTDQDGKELVGGIWGPYYTVGATDEEGNEYKVFWEITNQAAFEDGDEDCCDWDNPAIVFDDAGKNVTEKVCIC